MANDRLVPFPGILGIGVVRAGDNLVSFQFFPNYYFTIVDISRLIIVIGNGFFFGLDFALLRNFFIRVLNVS